VPIEMKPLFWNIHLPDSWSVLSLAKRICGSLY
jgi:hypothetical protein